MEALDTFTCMCPRLVKCISLPLYRAEASLSRLAELNPYVTVSLSTLDLTVNSDLSPLSQYQVNIHDHCLFIFGQARAS